MDKKKTPEEASSSQEKTAKVVAPSQKDQPSSSSQEGSMSSPDANLQQESLFQGENQIFPSRQNAANIEHQNQANQESNEEDPPDLPVNFGSNSAEGGSEEEDHHIVVLDAREPSLEECYSALLNRSNEPSVEPADLSVPVDPIDQPSTSAASIEPNLNRPVNILPVNRNLIDHSSNNLIAIGRKPQTTQTSPMLAKYVTRKKPLHPCPTAGSIIEHRANTLGWQADKKTLKERISHMYCNETLADVFFVVGSAEETRQTIPAHKFVLSIGSVVFDAMFNGGLTPRNTEDPLEIELPDVEPSAFLTLLKFLYSDEVSIGPESVMTTLYTAKKYAVPAMETACVDFLKESLGADNAFMLLAQSKLFDEPQLEQLCLELIDKKTLEALNGEGFTDIDLATLCDVLSRDSLRIRELHLFQATIRWATAECERRNMPNTPENRRAVLGTAIQLIRFPLMKIEEFALNVEPSMLLSDREMNKIFKYLAVNPSDRPVLVYSDRPRCLVSNYESVVSRFQRTEIRWGYCGTPDRIKFTVDRRIFVVGLGLYGSLSTANEYKVQIKIIHCGTSKTLAEHDTSFVCDGTAKPCRVCFKEPVEILPGVTYIASSLIRGPDTYYGTKGLRRIVLADSEVTFQFTYAAMNNNGTSVEDGQIPEIVFYTAQN